MSHYAKSKLVHSNTLYRHMIFTDLFRWYVAFFISSVLTDSHFATRLLITFIFIAGFAESVRLMH